MIRTQSNCSERRNKEIGSFQALGSSTQSSLTRKDWRAEIGSVRPEIAATGVSGFVVTRRDNVRQATWYACTIRGVLCAFETHKTAVSAVVVALADPASPCAPRGRGNSELEISSDVR